MRRFALVASGLLLLVALCACNGQPSESNVSTPVADDTESGATSSSTTTTGALVITDAQGSAVTETGGELVTTHVVSLPTTVRPVTDPQGSTLTEQDGTVQTEIVVPPHITVSTDTEGSTHTSRVTQHTVTTVTTTATTKQDAETIELPAQGYAPDAVIRLGAVTHKDGVVSMVICNESGVWEPDDGGSYFEYTCYDENDTVLTVGKIPFGFIAVKSSKLCTFVIPEGTTRVVLTDFKAEYWSAPV